MTEAILVGATTFNPAPNQLSVLLGVLSLWGSDAVVVDNSTDAVSRRRVAEACAASGIRYDGGHGNRGTAGALNSLLELANNSAKDWVFYLDQDSGVSPETKSRLSATLGQQPEDIAMVGSLVWHRTHQEQRPTVADAFTSSELLISSGTAVRVAAALKVGGFDEDFFLDLVDHEMCLRLRRAGYRLTTDHGRYIEHDIGEDSSLGGAGRIHVTRHPLWRRRLMWRNTLVMAARYARSFPQYGARLLAGRLAETVLGALHFREPGYLRTAFQGTVDAVQRKPSPRP